MQLEINEILTNFKKLTTKEERINFLRNTQPHHFKQWLENIFNDKEYYLPDLKEYKPSDNLPGVTHNTLSSELRKVYMFTKGDEIGDKLTEQKRKQLALELLESLTKEDAECFINMLKKETKTPYLTIGLIKEAGIL